MTEEPGGEEGEKGEEAGGEGEVVGVAMGMMGIWDVVSLRVGVFRMDDWLDFDLLMKIDRLR